MGSEFEALLKQRRSIRAYRPDPIPRAMLERIFASARLAPSGANLQPGQFHILRNEPLNALILCLKNAHEGNAPLESEYSYFPQKMPPALKERQRKAGYALYEALGISRRDVAQRRAQFARNYAFFDAPVGIVVTIERSMGKGCFMDLGMTLMALLLAAQDQGLGATGIGALANYASHVHAHLKLPEDQMVVCGIAMGFTQENAPVNQFKTERQSLSEFTDFYGFE